MPQVIAPPLMGFSLGAGPSAVGVLRILAGVGDPNVAATDPHGDIASSAVGSLFLRTDAPDSTHGLYTKTTFVSGAAGTWTAK
jgi:hypothetical protein